MENEKQKKDTKQKIPSFIQPCTHEYLFGEMVFAS